MRGTTMGGPDGPKITSVEQMYGQFAAEAVVLIPQWRARLATDPSSLAELEPEIPGAFARGADLIVAGLLSLATADLAQARQRMQAIGGRKLDLAVVVYTNQIDPGIIPILKDVDVVLLWTWKSSDLKNLEANFKRLKVIRQRWRA